MKTAFWKERTVLVTGHTGFKGTWLSLWLQLMGARVTGYALAPPTHPNLFEVTRAAQGMNSVVGDVRDAGMLNGVINTVQPEIVIHMAAQSLVRQSYDDPVGTYSTNVIGTVNVLDAVRKSPFVQAVLIVTSDKCYENREWLWGYRESEPMGGYDPYSSSKGCAELVTAAYRRSYFQANVGTATVRAGNVIGGGDWAANRLVPDLLDAFTNNKMAFIRNPRAVRPWQHVLDPLAGYLTLAEHLCADKPAYSEAWNFGPADEDVKPVSWIAAHLAERWGGGAGWRVDDALHPHEAGYLKLDCSKARTQLGWAPRLRLEQALDWIVEWHRQYIDGNDVKRFTEDQIMRYQQGERC